MPWSDAGWLTLAFVVGLAGTWLARRYALRRHLLDQPGERRSHAAATPRGGGIAIVLVLLPVSAWLAVQFVQMRMMLAGFTIGLALVAATGWLDDHRPLSPWLRLGVHVLASALFAAGVWQVTTDPLLSATAFVVTVVLVNVWNFMDGIDGIAATQAVVVALCLGVMTLAPWSWLAWVLVAATCGFLPFNFPRARMFLGDVGSNALGYAMGGLSTAALLADGTNWPLLLLPLAAFLVDAGLTLLRRVLRGEAWWTAHVQHAYQVCARRLGSHVPVTVAFALWTVTGAVLAVVFRDAAFTTRIITLLVWYTVTGVAWIALQRGDISRN